MTTDPHFEGSLDETVREVLWDGTYSNISFQSRWVRGARRWRPI